MDRIARRCPHGCAYKVACAISVGQRHAEYNRTGFDEQVIDLTGQIKPA